MLNDLISRQAAIDALDEIEAEVADGYGYQYAKWREYFVEMPSAQPEQRWIPVSERLPRPYEQVLRTVKSFGWNCTPHTHVDIGTICPIDTDVIAWMPLPEPYKAERTEE